VRSQLPATGPPPSERGRGSATSITSAQAAGPGRAPWRSLGATAASVGAPLGTAILHPLLGEVMAVIELLAILTVVGTALYGSQALSERTFRLLRWLGNRPEPPGPGDKGSAAQDGEPPDASIAITGRRCCERSAGQGDRAAPERGSAPTR
jgi:hypothetical protein